jgi:hypothetical protein
MQSELKQFGSTMNGGYWECGHFNSSRVGVLPAGSTHYRSTFSSAAGSYAFSSQPAGL